jgi:hypothetical protein
VEIAIAVAGRLLSTSTSGVRGKRPALIDRPMPIVTTRVATRRRSWWSWSWSPSPTAGLAQLLGQHLDGGPGAAVSGGPAVLSQELAGSSCVASGSLSGRPVALSFIGELLQLPFIHAGQPILTERG